MPRINPIETSNADPKSAALLGNVQKALGMTPNLMSTLAHSPASLGAYLGFGQALGGGTLGAKLREQLAVAIAGANNCEYCASAHTALGGGLGVPGEELARNLQGASTDNRTNAAIGFARAIVERRGWVTDEELANARGSGLSESDIVEIVAVVAINTFSNYFNHVAGTEVDFPRVAINEAVTA